MKRTFWLVSLDSNNKKTTSLSKANARMFQDDANEVTMYYVGPGEA